MKGHTFKRCPCGSVHDERGNRVNCPKKHGTWYYAHELPPDADGRRRQVRKGGFRTEKGAREAMTEALGRVATGTWVDYPKITVGEYLDQWLAGKVLRPSTRRSYAEHIRLYLRPGLGHLGLQDVRDAHVEQLYAAMRELGEDGEESGELPGDLLQRLLDARRYPDQARTLSPARLRRVHATLMSALNSGVKRRKLPANPAQYVEVPTGRRPRAVVWTAERIAHWKATGEHSAVAVWTAEQTGAYLDAAAEHRLYPVYHLIAYRGLRRGEAVGVRWQDVDLTGRRLTVAQQIVQLGWATEVGAPKTDSGERIIALDAATVQVLLAWQKRQAAEYEQAGDAWQATGLVFTREDGTGLHPDLVTDTFHRLRETAGLPPIRLHDLRHTAASLALQAGVPMKAVSELLGHSSFAITLDTYTSVLPDVAAAAAEAVAGIVPRKTPEPVDAEQQPRSQSVPTAGEKGSEANQKQTEGKTNMQVRGREPRGDRTHNPRIPGRCSRSSVDSCCDLHFSLSRP